MEDLSSLRQGDQIIGINGEEALKTVEIIAKLHARFWNNGVIGTNSRPMELTKVIVKRLFSSVVEIDAASVLP